MDKSDHALEVLEQDIAERLAAVCSHMDAESFRELVHDIAVVKVKYGVQSLGSEQLYSEIGDAVVVARVETHIEQPPGNNAA
ncbi:MAG TPA: hypothetical protein VNC11_12565 [Gemmatimonadaceae bacterium]|jgi:hypothetical protein|nr:hypothetical protein [Gemmatimonadaceae bacterium]